MACAICGADHTTCPGATSAPRFVVDLARKEIGAMWTSDERLYLDKDGTVVKANDPTKQSLLVGAGGSIPLEQAQALGLTDEAKAKVPPANKAKAAPSNKAAAKE